MQEEQIIRISREILKFCVLHPKREYGNSHHDNSHHDNSQRTIRNTDHSQRDNSQHRQLATPTTRNATTRNKFDWSIDELIQFWNNNSIGTIDVYPIHPYCSYRKNPICQQEFT